jgi:hypothetical protein
MKKIKYIFFYILLSNSAFSQIMSEHIYKYENSINPIFSKVSKQILITFDKNSLIDTNSKFIYILKIDISDRKSELTGISNGTNFNSLSGFGSYGVMGGVLASGFSSQKQFSFKNTNGFVLFNKLSFDSLNGYSKKIIEIIDSKKGPQNYNSSYYFKVDKLELSLEIEQKDFININDYVITKNILMKIDESVFIFTDEEFKKLYKETLSNIKGMWDSY